MGGEELRGDEGRGRDGGVRGEEVRGREGGVSGGEMLTTGEGGSGRVSEVELGGEGKEMGTAAGRAQAAKGERELIPSWKRCWRVS